MKKLDGVLFLLVFLFLSCYDLQAYHIIGGETTYKCLGNNIYEITMIMYRDCSAVQGADFDSNPGQPDATTTIWRDDLSMPFIRTIVMNPPTVTRLDPDDLNPCLIVPPNVCVEKGVYRFQVELPQSTSSYQIVYQRCCRNISVANIQNPDEVGATFHVEITPEAQGSCSDSPVFDELPPMVICAGSPIEIDQSVFNIEPGATVEYSLCTPLAGGGNRGTNPGEDPTLPDGVTPDPDTRPPFEQVRYRAGFDAQNPISASEQLRIDPVTGIMTGTPDAVGQYIVGLCVTQRRDGKILSEIKRDFQFNVVECMPKVFADIEADFQGDDKLLLSCGGRTVHVKNNSYAEEFIRSYEWVFKDDGQQQVMTERDLNYTFSDTGIYEVLMYVNKDIDKCDDSIRFKIEVRNEIIADFSIEGDSCDATSVYVENKSYSGNGSITDYEWEFEQGNTSPERTPDFQFQSPGDKEVILLVKDRYNCIDTAVREYPYYPRPTVVDIELIADILCTDSELRVKNKSYPLDDSYQVNWILSNGQVYEGVEPIFQFEEEGSLDLTLEIISPIGCYRSEDFSSFFEIFTKPEADFDYEPKKLNQFNKSVEFINLSTGADSYEWLFYPDGSSTEKNPFFVFPDTGYKEITLWAISDNGCLDSLTRILDVEPEPTYFLPNAFTPDDDGINDGYRGEGYLEYIDEFKMNIYSRYGEKVFETDDPMEEWNGNYMNTGKRLPQGVYVVQVQFVSPRGQVIKKKGLATLLD